MLNYLHSEIYRTIRQRGLWMFLLLCLFSLFLIALSESELANVAEYLDMVYIGVILSSIVLPAVFSALNRKEKGVHIQMISFGMKREIVFIGDYIMLCLNVLVVGILVVAASLGMALLLFGQKPYEAEVLTNFIKNAANVYLVLLPLNALAQGLTYLLANNGLAIAAFYLGAYVLPGLLLNLSKNSVVAFLVNLLPARYLLDDLSLFASKWFTICIGVNLLFWLAVAAVAYKRKEF